jgi:ATP-dependent DNA helicase RecG
MTIIPLILQATPQVTPQAELYEEDDRIREILEFCKTAKSRDEIQDYIGLKDRKGFRIRILNPLINGSLLKLTIHYCDKNL